MDDEIPGPFRPERRLTDYEKTKPLSLAEQAELLNFSGSDEEPFLKSESEYEPNETSSSEASFGTVSSKIFCHKRKRNPLKNRNKNLKTSLTICLKNCIWMIKAPDGKEVQGVL
ncbi:hypothetical protein JTB14_031545 [Gonioctena quinquepunctata]|nr:hypothetical protein JTB14_031545 [Gonioctena quinquepunctata]